MRGKGVPLSQKNSRRWFRPRVWYGKGNETTTHLAQLLFLCCWERTDKEGKKKNPGRAKSAIIMEVRRLGKLTPLELGNGGRSRTPNGLGECDIGGGRPRHGQGGIEPNATITKCDHLGTQW